MKHDEGIHRAHKELFRDVAQLAVQVEKVRGYTSASKDQTRSWRSRPEPMLGNASEVWCP